MCFNLVSFIYIFSFLFYGPEDGSKHGVTAPPRSNSMSSSGPLTFDSGLNSVSPSHSVSDSQLSSSQTQSKLNGDSGINMSPPPINLKTHPSLRRRSNDSSSSIAHAVQRSASHDASQASSSSQLDDDLQFPCGRETPGSDKSDSNEQLNDGFRPRVHQVSHSKEQYEVMNHPSKRRTESAPPAPTGASNYVHMNPSGNGKTTSESRRSLPTNNYVNHVIPADMKAPVENYENTGFNGMKVPPIPSKGTADNLITIQEGAPLRSYENHTLPVDTTYVNNGIRPLPSDQYENTSPHSSPPSAAATPVNNYQNITLDTLTSPRMNTHEKVVLKKTERKNSVKDSGSLQYSEIDSCTPENSVSPPKLQRQYSDIDYSATMAVEAQQRQRTIQKEHTQQMKVH